jgi:hypothetical protein
MTQTSKQQLATQFREIGVLERHVRKTFLQIGKCLHRVRDLCAEEKVSFKDTLEEHGIAYRKASYLVGIYEASLARNFDRTRLLGIGWTKAAFLLPLFGKGNDSTLFAMAETSSVVEIQRYVAGRPVPERLTSCVFSLGWRDLKFLNAQLVRNGALPARNGHGFTGREEAMMKLVRRGASLRAQA